MTGTKRPRTRFTHLVEVGTVSAIVFAYLNGELAQSFSQREGKHRAVDALLAFWKPYALRAQQAYPEAVQAAARSSLEALARQMRAGG